MELLLLFSSFDTNEGTRSQITRVVLTTFVSLQAYERPIQLVLQFVNFLQIHPNGILLKISMTKTIFTNARQVANDSYVWRVWSPFYTIPCKWLRLKSNWITYFYFLETNEWGDPITTLNSPINVGSPQIFRLDSCLNGTIRNCFILCTCDWNVNVGKV